MYSFFSIKLDESADVLCIMELCLQEFLFCHHLDDQVVQKATLSPGQGFPLSFRLQTVNVIKHAPRRPISSSSFALRCVPWSLTTVTGQSPHPLVCFVWGNPPLPGGHELGCDVCLSFSYLWPEKQTTQIYRAHGSALGINLDLQCVMLNSAE